MTRERSDRVALWLIVLAFVRIALAEPVFSVTPDEPMHVMEGLQILSEHRYGIQIQNPPLARVLLAIGPWLAGVRIDPNRGIFDQIDDVFHSTGHYIRDLALARAGSVLTLILAALALWRLARRELEPGATLLAVLLFTTQPVILGYAAIANHDTPSVAGLAIAMLAFVRWIERPAPARAAEVGAAYAFAIAMKFASILYVPVACGVYFVVRLLQKRAKPERVVAAIAAALGAFVIALWASYGFTFGKLVAPDYITQLFGNGPRATRAFALAQTISIPAPHFFGGILELFTTNRTGHPAYAFGHFSQHGWWWYFPATVALKTTLGSMLLLVAGVVVARKNREFVAMAVTAAAILASSLTAHLDVGIRYVLPLFVPFSIAAGAAAYELWQRKRIIAIALLGWHLVASTIAHPDYFPYFNELGGRDPSRYLVDSNLDWGQDVLRLRHVVRQKHIDSIGVDVLGPHDFVKLKFPRVTDVLPTSRGWVAISDHAYRGSPGAWWWLPHDYERVGKSIRLYHLTAR